MLDNVNKLKDREVIVRGLRDSSPYVQAHRGQTFVVLLQGEAVADPHFADLAHDLGMLAALGVKLVLVHGARAQIEKRLAESGIEQAIVDGVRVTDATSLAGVKQAIGSVRLEIEAAMSVSQSPGRRLRIASGNLVIAKPVGIRDGVDFLYTGEVRRVDTDAIADLLEHGDVVLISPLGYSATGEAFNLHAEEVAVAVAEEMHADKLIVLDETGGVTDASGDLARELTLEQATALLAEKRKAGVDITQLNHLEHMAHACRNGVHRVHVVDRKIDGGLLLELFTRDGVGTLISAGSFDNLRQATVDDVGGIHELLRPLESEGFLARRSRDKLEMETEHFCVLERDRKIIGCAALYPYPEEAMAELACLVVHGDYTGSSRGQQLLNHVEKTARQSGIKKLFVLTTRAEHWFVERGFVTAQLNDLPMEKQSLYNYQRNSKVFIKTL